MTFLHIAVSLPRKSVVRLTDRPDMTLDIYRGRKTTIQWFLRYLSGVCMCVCVCVGGGVYSFTFSRACARILIFY